VSEFQYNDAYDPPLPVCDVVLTAASTGLRVAVEAVIDTGADATIVPVQRLLGC
jgi:hypothetical protein